MDGLSQFLQSGGSGAMGLINNQSGGALPAITLVFTIIFPILFFLISKIAHDNLDEDRAEDDTSYGEDELKDGEFNKKDYVIWGLYSIKVNLFMMALCYGMGWMLGWLFHKIPNMAPAIVGSTYWKACFGLMIITHAWSILFGGLKSTAYQYFVDDLYENRAKMEKTCIEFGCGFAPHGSEPVKRGEDYRE
jgi:hypothetical protein